VNIIGEADDVAPAIHLIQSQNPDLVLLDIEMPNGTGFDVLQALGEVNFEVVFITAHDRYALRAIKFCCLDYILKPVDIKELIQAVHRASEKLKERNSTENFSHLLSNIQDKNPKQHKIALPTQEGLVFIKVDDIMRCEADGSYTRIILKDKSKIIATRKIKGFEELLTDYHFFRVHRSHLVNLEYIEKYHKGEGGYIIMSDGTSVDVSRRKKDEFLEQLNSI
ncbi:MAG: LytR/AlgR family response regulator transcription factor, partial [Saprospiraceae bacterium]